MRRRLPARALTAALVALRLAAPDPVVAQAQASAPAPTPTPRARGAGIGIGTLAWLDQGIERAELPAKASWQRLREGDALRTGDSFRTAPDATARFEFPWMAVTLGGSTMLTIPASSVLSTVLEQGRAEFAGPGREIVKITVGEGEVRGGGRLVLRRSVGRTTAAALEGSFRVRAAGPHGRDQGRRGDRRRRRPAARGGDAAAWRARRPRAREGPALRPLGPGGGAALDGARSRASRGAARARPRPGAARARRGRAAAAARAALARDLPLARRRARRPRCREPALGRRPDLLVDR